MLIFGSYDLLYNQDVFNFKVINMSSYKEGFGGVVMTPPVNVDYTSKEFDMLYAQYILSDNIFYNFFSNIIIPISKGIDLYVLVHRNELFDILTESVQKLISSRYGYISYLVNEIEDFNMIDESLSGFSVNGVYNLDQDKNRYIYWYAMNNRIGDIYE